MNTPQTIEWLNMRLVVPADWEIVRHNVSASKGRLVFVDRRQQRLLLRWAACAKAPDLKRLLEDYRSREQGECRDLTVAGWTGYRTATLTRAGRYESQLNRWLELTSTGNSPELETTVLKDFAVTAGNRCRAFGVDIEAPAGWTLTSAAVKPADLRIVYRQGRAEASVRRLGLTREWYDGNAERFIETNRPAPPRLVRLLGRRHPRDRVWESAPEQALYHVQVLAPRKAPIRPEDFIVRSAGVPPLDRSSTPVLSEMLGAIPTPNTAVHADHATDGSLVLRVPLERRWFMRPPVTWILPFSRERAIALDRLGADVWRACDGRQTVEQLVEAFAAQHRVSFHEARLSVMQFLRDLTRRGLVVMVVPKP